MKFEYRIEPSEDQTYILLSVVGEFTAKNFMKCILETHARGQEMGIHRYLVDAIKAKNIDTVLGNYQFAYSDMQTTKGIDPLAVVAGVVSKDDHSHDFVETVSNNAGKHLKLFTDFNQAVDYLNRFL